MLLLAEVNIMRTVRVTWDLLRHIIGMQVPLYAAYQAWVNLVKPYFCTPRPQVSLLPLFT